MPVPWIHRLHLRRPLLHLDREGICTIVQDPVIVQQRIQEHAHVQETPRAGAEMVGRQKRGFEILVEKTDETQSQSGVVGLNLEHQLPFILRLVGKQGLERELDIVEPVDRQIVT